MSLLFALPGNAKAARALAAAAGWQVGRAEMRRFPDGESHVRVDSDVAGRDAALVCTLARPDGRFLGLAFAARLLRELGARSVTLIAPYLCYMRQDARFREGEAVTSVMFADLLGREIDRLVTMTPHLHRHRSLDAIYKVPTVAASAAPVLAEWVKRQVARPLIVGPDAESRPWIAEIAALAQAPAVVLDKVRTGDRKVEIALPSLAEHRDRRPVLVDDILASGATMEQAAQRLIAQGFPAPDCLVVHALPVAGAAARLAAIGCRLVSTDTVPHPSNRLSVMDLLAIHLPRARAGREATP